MRIGAIGGIGTYQPVPYIYNTNQISAASLDPVDRIPDDATAGRTDFTGLVDEQENENDLALNETRDIQSVFEQQFLKSARNAERVFPEMQEAFGTTVLAMENVKPAEQPADQKVEADEDFGRGVAGTEAMTQMDNGEKTSPYDLWQLMSQGAVA
ncbi:MAG: hypothetical protein K6E33_08840 [Lachnospiraceae bacterium]|nr:hypothetical protein [Lachnospiraceae bacterium]